MNRRSVPALVVLMFLLAPILAAAQDASDGSAAIAPLSGLPVNVIEAKISGYNDGDKIEITRNGTTYEVNLIGEDAPEPGECFALESAGYLTRLLKNGSTVYLESDTKEKDGKDRLLRYVWAANSKGDKAYLVNELLISKGYASFVSKDGNTKYDKRLKSAQDYAKKHKLGLWAACDSPHGGVKVVPTPTHPAVAPASYSIFTEEQVDAPNQRRRWVLRITMDPNTSPEAQVAGIADAVRLGVTRHPDATCIVVFANSFDTDSGIDIGRGFVSKDGKGLDGEGEGLITDDDGRIQIQLWNGTDVYYEPR